MNNETTTSAPEAPKANLFKKLVGDVGHSIGFFAGKVAEGFKAATAKVEATAKAVTATTKKVATAAYTKVSSAAQSGAAVVTTAVSAVALGVAAVVTGVAKAIWNVNASDVLSLLWLVAGVAAVVFGYAAAFAAALVMVAITVAPATALVAELAPAAAMVLTYAAVGLISWLVAAVIEVGQFSLVRICQRVHACIERAASDLATNMRTAGAKVRHALTVDAVAVAAA